MPWIEVGETDIYYQEEGAGHSHRCLHVLDGAGTGALVASSLKHQCKDQQRRRRTVGAGDRVDA